MTSAYLDKFIAAGFLFTIAFTVFANWAAQDWMAVGLESLIILLMLLWLIKLILERKFDVKVPLTAYPIAAFLILGLIQCIAWTDSSGQTVGISQDITATRETVKIIFFLLLGHLIAANFFNTRQRLHTLTNFLTGFGLFVAIFGLMQSFGIDQKILQLLNIEEFSQKVSDPFQNYNHLAGFLNLLIPIPIALLITRVPKRFPLFYIFAAIMMAVCIFASPSKIAILSLCTGLIFMMIAGIYFANRSKLSYKRWINKTGSSYLKRFSWSIPCIAASVVIIFAVSLGILWIAIYPAVANTSGATTVRKTGEMLSIKNTHFWIWQNSLNIIQANPVYGTGMGSFGTVFIKYANTDKVLDEKKNFTVTATYNEYLQVLTDTGLVGGLIAVCFIITLTFTIMGSLRARDRFYAGVAIAASAAACTLLIHSAFDINLQHLSTALLFLTLIAVLPKIAATVNEPLFEFTKQIEDESDETMFALGETS